MKRSSVFLRCDWGFYPAIISPYVLAKIGLSRARALFINGNRFSAEVALNVGLIHEVVEAPELDRTLQHHLDAALASAPGAVAATKQLLRELSLQNQAFDPSLVQEQLTTRRHHTTRTIAACRRGEEAQKGMAAFLAHQKPPWAL